MSYFLKIFQVIVYKKVTHFFLFVYIKKCTLWFSDDSHYNFHVYAIAIFICKTCLYIQKVKKTIPVYVRIFFKSQIRRALLSNKNGILHYWKSQWFNSYKIVRKCTKQPYENIKSFFVHNTIQLLNSVMHYLNTKINLILVEKINAQLFSALKWERCRKSGCLGLYQV